MQDQTVREKIGARIRESRKALPMTQQELASELGVNRQAVSMWETGKSMPRSSEWYRLGPLLGVSLDYLVYGIRTIPASPSHMLRAALQPREAMSA